MPRYNVESYCQEVSDVSGGSSMIYNFCIDQEQTAYNMLKASWSWLGAHLKRYCDEVASFGGGSYMLLDCCIQIESDAASGQRASNTDDRLDLPLPGLRQILDFTNTDQLPKLSFVPKPFGDGLRDEGCCCRVTRILATCIRLTIETAKLAQWNDDRIC